MKIGLILSGGMAKGAYQIGALRAIGEHLAPEEISYISAASVGAINALAFSGGQLELAEELWRSINRGADRIFLSSLYKSEFFKHAVSSAAEISPLCKKLYTPVLNFRRREVVYLDLLSKSTEDRALYVRAAMTFPPFSKPVNIHGDLFCDGALADNIPYRPLLACEVDYVICIYFDNYDYIFESEGFTHKVIKVPFAEDSRFISTSLWFTKEGISDMIRLGYQKTARILQCVLGQGKDNAELIYERIRGMNDWNTPKKLHLTGDMIVNNVNRLFDKFAKRKIVD